MVTYTIKLVLSTYPLPVFKSPVFPSTLGRTYTIFYPKMYPIFGSVFIMIYLCIYLLYKRCFWWTFFLVFTTLTLKQILTNSVSESSENEWSGRWNGGTEVIKFTEMSTTYKINKLKLKITSWQKYKLTHHKRTRSHQFPCHLPYRSMN
jgi:hypothetical protein